MKNQNETVWVPVLDLNQKPLMPTTPSRARRWTKDGKATGFWKRGIYCVRLNQEPSARKLQPIAAGIDTGSKKEAITVKSEDHTFINIQMDAVTWVRRNMKTLREMRVTRRSRNTPCRKNRKNRKHGGLPPSTKARWQWKLRICSWLLKMFPIVVYVVEDIQAKTKRQPKWDKSFSPLQVGKNWFYQELAKIGEVNTLQGWQTKELRDSYCLKKARNKLREKFSSHCVDSWALANWWTGGHTKPDNKRMLCITPIQFHRRQLHKLQPAIGGRRIHYGGTISHGFKKGSLVTHIKYGLVHVGGYQKDRITLRSVVDGTCTTQRAKPLDCKFISYNTWRTRLLFI